MAVVSLIENGDECVWANAVRGFRIAFPYGWGLLRASNTQPVLVLRFEAESEARLKEIGKIIEAPLKAWLKEMCKEVG